MMNYLKSILLRTVVCLMLIFLSTAKAAAEDDCYYLGKGALGLMGTGLDLYATYNLAQMEHKYQAAQIELQSLMMSGLAAGGHSYEGMERINRLNEKIMKYQAIKLLMQQFGDNLNLSALIDKSGC